MQIKVSGANGEMGFIALFCGMPRDRGGFSRHLSDVQWLQGDTAICGNAPARRSGGRLCWEATRQGISWSPMRPWRASPWPRFSTRGLFRDWHIGHQSHASVNPDAVRHFEIPPNSAMNPFCTPRTEASDQQPIIPYSLDRESQACQSTSATVSRCPPTLVLDQLKCSVLESIEICSPESLLRYFGN